MTHCDEAVYVATLIMLYVDLPDTPLRPGPQDQSTARRLYGQGVPLSLVESALLLASLRRLVRNSDLPPLAPIRSLAYFQPVIAELQQQPRQPDTSITSASNSRKWRLCGRKPNPAYETLRRPSAIYPQQRVPLPLAR